MGTEGREGPRSADRSPMNLWIGLSLLPVPAQNNSQAADTRHQCHQARRLGDDLQIRPVNSVLERGQISVYLPGKHVLPLKMIERAVVAGPGISGVDLSLQISRDVYFKPGGSLVRHEVDKSPRSRVEAPTDSASTIEAEPAQFQWRSVPGRTGLAVDSELRTAWRKCSPSEVSDRELEYPCTVLYPSVVPKPDLHR